MINCELFGYVCLDTTPLPRNWVSGRNRASKINVVLGVGVKMRPVYISALL